MISRSTDAGILRGFSPRNAPLVRMEHAEAGQQPLERD
jgi:hypothetical protein